MSAYDTPGYRTMPTPMFFSSPGMAAPFMLPSYTATFVPIPVAGMVANDWPALTETDALVAAEAGSVAAATAPAAASVTARAQPTRRARRPLGSLRTRGTSDLEKFSIDISLHFLGAR